LGRQISRRREGWSVRLRPCAWLTRAITTVPATPAVRGWLQALLLAPQASHLAVVAVGSLGYPRSARVS
jgi:hypothetical protein